MLGPGEVKGVQEILGNDDTAENTLVYGGLVVAIGLFEEGKRTVAKERHIGRARDRDPEGEPSSGQPKVGFATKETHLDADGSL